MHNIPWKIGCKYPENRLYRADGGKPVHWAIIIWWAKYQPSLGISNDDDEGAEGAEWTSWLKSGEFSSLLFNSKCRFKTT